MPSWPSCGASLVPFAPVGASDGLGAALTSGYAGGIAAARAAGPISDFAFDVARTCRAGRRRIRVGTRDCRSLIVTGDMNVNRGATCTQAASVAMTSLCSKKVGIKRDKKVELN